VRIDKWLCAARVFKSRTIATDACAAGHVRLNGDHCKAHAPLRVGDQVHANTEGGHRVLVVLGLAEKRLSAPLARLLYEDHSPPPPPGPRGGPIGRRDRGAGRPTKREGRLIRGLRGKG